MKMQDIMLQAAEFVRPPERLTVAEASEKFIRINNPGSYSGPWRNSVAPYLVEVMEEMTSHDRIGIVFCTSAQAGKTQISLNWIAHTVICDPMNFMLVEKTQTTSRDFSRMRMDKMLMDSPEVGGRLRSKRHDNVYDKKFKSGVTVLLSWPTINNLSGKPIPRIALSDYDRMDQDVGGEGTPFDLAQARTTTFGHYGMTFAESSPSHDNLDSRWSPNTPHEAPPVQGILGLYNRGDRRRWYWTCISCNHAFEPDFSLMRWPETDSALESAEQAYMACPECGQIYHHDPVNGVPGKHGMNAKGLWLRDNQRKLKSGEIVGEVKRNLISSFWLKGVAAAFKSWDKIVFNWINANETYEQTDTEEDLRATTNVDQGMPYMPKILQSDRLPEDLKNQAMELGMQVVPEGVRFLVAAIDVQKRRFVVQVHGVKRGGDLVVIDRFNIKLSLDMDEELAGQKRRVRPNSEIKDWRLLLREVLLKTYPLGDESGRTMPIKAAICDSGGAEDTTANAYAFWRWLHRGPQKHDKDYEEWEDEWQPGLVNRFALFKGRIRSEARVVLTYPESSGGKAAARGVIPVLQGNTNLLKDQLNSMIDRESDGTGRISFPKWLGMGFFRELCAETRDKDGKWINPKQFRNESWDLFVMTLALLTEPVYIGIELIDWSEPPEWAEKWDKNPLISMPEGISPIVHLKKDSGQSFNDLGRVLG